ncbi:MAG: prephenate dehydrogenase/arogenate dehydrogenase family protein [Gammaproteobacteria bacterium]|nr:prephenate dehydrogenase/arogenate dehydrogenase family protein [Gammaproteobacteria bacterium]
MSAEILFDRLTIVGLGLMGASLALALRRRGAVGEIVGVSRTEATAARAVELGVVDWCTDTPNAAAEGADAVVIATPVRTVPQMLQEIDAGLPAHAVITDVGSVKGYIVDQARTILGSTSIQRFVPGHPIAGTERSGVDAAFAELYEKHHVVLTPLKETDPQALNAVRSMWEVAGSDVIEMPVEQHDGILAATSHLPHVMAYALVGYLADDPRGQRMFELAAGGFYDFTRIASSDPTMWRDICLTNQQCIVTAIQGFRKRIDSFVAAIEAGDGDQLIRLFERAKQARDTGLERKTRR